jgi:hypothetical protein
MNPHCGTARPRRGGTAQPSGCLRGGGLTGPNHSGIEPHGAEDIARCMFEFWKDLRKMKRKAGSRG